MSWHRPKEFKCDGCGMLTEGSLSSAPASPPGWRFCFKPNKTGNGNEIRWACSSKCEGVVDP